MVYAPFRRDASWARFRGVVVAIDLLVLCTVFDPGPARADSATAQTANENDFNPFALCPKCKLLIGAGETYQFWGWSHGVVLPVTLELDESRWELGAFRVATRQVAIGHGYPPPDYTSPRLSGAIQPCDAGNSCTAPGSGYTLALAGVIKIRSTHWIRHV
jgi:hypothetical protein